MKLAFVVPGFSADERDWCIPANTDLVRLLALSHEVHVFTLRYPHRVDTYPIGNATVHSFNGVGSRGTTSARLWQTAFSEISREHQRGKFDMIQSIFGGEAGCVAVLAARWLRAPSSIWLADGELIGLPEISYGADLIPRQRWMNSLNLRFANRVFCGCDSMTELARSRMPSSHRFRAKTLPWGLNTQRFTYSPRTLNGHAPHLVNVGSLSPVKAQATLLQVFAHLIQKLPDARMTIAGIGALENELKTLARTLKIETRVTFAGNIEHDQLPALYHSADIFVQTSRHEGEGMALLEAAASGCPVCGTDVGVLHDLSKRDAALTAPVGDVDALTQVVKRTWEQRAQFAARVGEIVHREYNLEQITTRLLDEYQNLTAHSKPIRTIRPFADA